MCIRMLADGLLAWLCEAWLASEKIVHSASFELVLAAGGVLRRSKSSALLGSKRAIASMQARPS